MKTFLFRLKAYFFRGHNGWFVYVLWFTNAIGIWYLAIVPEARQVKIVNDILGPIMKNIWIFGFILIITYCTAAIIVGKLDYQGGGYATESEVVWQNNPEWMRQVKRTTKIEKMIDKIASELNIEGLDEND